MSAPTESFAMYLRRRRRLALIPLALVTAALWLYLTLSEVGFVVDVLAPF